MSFFTYNFSNVPINNMNHFFRYYSHFTPILPAQTTFQFNQATQTLNLGYETQLSVANQSNLTASISTYNPNTDFETSAYKYVVNPLMTNRFAYSNYYLMSSFAYDGLTDPLSAIYMTTYVDAGNYNVRVFDQTHNSVLVESATKSNIVPEQWSLPFTIPDRYASTILEVHVKSTSNLTVNGLQLCYSTSNIYP